MADPEKIAESLRKHLMRRATVDATTEALGVDDGQFGFYVYFRDGTKVAVHVTIAEDYTRASLETPTKGKGR